MKVFNLTFFCQILPLYCTVLPLLDKLKMLMPDVVDNFNPINYFKEYSIITCTIRMHCSEEKNIYTSLSRSRTWWRVFNKSGLACNQCCGHQWPVFPSWPGRAPSRERATRSYFTRLQVNWCSGPQSWVTEAFLLFLMGILKICLFSQIPYSCLLFLWFSLGTCPRCLQTEVPFVSDVNTV